MVLRYASNQDGPLLAYDYGAHKEDYKQIIETHQARLARWKQVMERKSASGGYESSSLVSHKKKKTIQKQGSTVASKKDARISSQPSTSTITIGEAAAADLVYLDEISVPETILNDTDTSMICIMCQGKTADVVFVPCHHCVLCFRCSETMCRRFCPSCRTTITARLQPSSIRVVRPRIVSSYSFI